MQNKKSQNQSQIHTRRLHERVGAVVLIVGTLAGTMVFSHEARRVLSNLAMRPAIAIIEHSGKESETAREDINVQNVFRATAISGN